MSDKRTIAVWILLVLIGGPAVAATATAETCFTARTGGSAITYVRTDDGLADRTGPPPTTFLIHAHPFALGGRLDGLEQGEVWTVDDRGRPGPDRLRFRYHWKSTSDGIAWSLGTEFLAAEERLALLVFHGDRDGLRLDLARSWLDCSVAASPVFLAVQAAAERIRQEWPPAAEASPARAPADLRLRLLVLALAGNPLWALTEEGCANLPVLRGSLRCQAHPGIRTWDECVACCEKQVGPLSAGCMVGAAASCATAKDPFGCLGAAGTCGGVHDFETGVCAAKECRGKPGDPNCPEPPPCETEAGGQCQYFCFTSKPICGACPDDEFGARRVCCTP